MSATMTIHFACDGCGKRVDTEQVHPNQDAYPDGWQHGSYRMYGDFCSEPCLRQALVAQANEDARRAFTPSTDTVSVP